MITRLAILGSFVCAALFFLSCEEESAMGYIALSDPDAPQLVVDGLPASITVLDTTSTLLFTVRAEDYFGVVKIVAMVDDRKLYTWQHDPVRSASVTASIALDTSLIGKQSTITVVAYDGSGNGATASPVTMFVKPTFVAASRWDRITVPERASPTVIVLDSVFVDSIGGSATKYEILSNSNSGLVKAQLTGNVLVLTPKPYLTGTSTIALKATNGKRVLKKIFDAQVVLSAPFAKVAMPDSSFRNILRDKYGFTDLHENFIVQEQAETLQTLIMDFPPRVSSFTGLSAFRNVTMMHLIQKYPSSGTIDLSNCTKLRTFGSDYLDFQQIDLSPLTDLESVYISGSSMDSLSLTTQKHLKTLVFGQGHLERISVVQNTELTELVLWLSGGGISEIDLSANTALQRLVISQCDQFPALDISKNTLLTDIDLRYNATLTTTYVWTLPLPASVKIQKDTFNTLVKK